MSLPNGGPLAANPIKIAVYALNYAPEPTGIGPFASDLAAGLRKRGHDVTVVAGIPHYPQWAEANDWSAYDAASLHDLGIQIIRKRHMIPRKHSLLRRTAMELSFGLRAARADVADADLVFCISPSLIATAAVLFGERLRRRRRPVVVWVQDLYGMGVAGAAGADTGAAKMATTMESRILGAATALAAIHDKFKAQLVDQMHIDPAAIAVFRNWSRQEPIPAAGRAEALQRLGWQSLTERTIVVHAGSMGAKQGLDNVVRAAALADGQSEPVTFVLLGDGTQRPILEELAGTTRSIRFVDVLDTESFGYALRAADVLLVNQQDSAADMCVPSKLLSYYSAGRPVVAAVNPEGITADEIRESRAGVAVPAGDPKRLLDEVTALAHDQQAREDMGEAGRRFVQREFDRASTIDAMSEWLIGLAMAVDQPDRPSQVQD